MTLEMPTDAKAQPSSLRSKRSAKPGLPRRLSRQIARFERPARAKARRIVRDVPRAADLVEIFPAVLYALATEHGTEAQRAHALDVIDAGGQLKTVARVLGLPMWLRRLPPEAFRGPIDGLPLSDAFARRIAGRIPIRAAGSADWLDAICFAEKAAGTDFALWLARQRSSCHAGPPELRLAILAAYCWHSAHLDTPAGRLVWSRWRSEIALDTAVCAAKSWFNRILLSVRLAKGVIHDSWLDAGRIGDFTFTPLIDSAALIEESRCMNNCADQYVHQIADGRCRLFSVQLKNMHVATLEITAHPRERGALTINQLKGRHNMPATLDVWQASHAWLATQTRLVQPPLPQFGERPDVDGRIWEELFAPYRAAVGGADWIPRSPNLKSVVALDQAICGLANESEIRSWLFI